MSYLRYGELSEEGASDVYVFMDVDGYLVCHSCLLLSAYYGPSFEAHSTQAMIGHLEQHRAAGHCVPDFDGVVAELWADDAENFPAECGGDGEPAADGERVSLCGGRRGARSAAVPGGGAQAPTGRARTTPARTRTWQHGRRSTACC